MGDDDDDDSEMTETRELRLLNAEEESPHSQRDRAYLIVLVGSNVGQMYRLRGEALTIGRGTNASIRLSDDGISRSHARIRVEGSEVIIEDLGSVNGVHINGVKATKAELRDGDKIRVGSTTILKFTYTDQLDETFQQQMYNAALRDGLTGTFNKAYLLQRLDNEFAYALRHQSPLSVVMFDVDHFKVVNDTHGHLAGDHVLAEIARRVQATLRVEDVLARYGGEEFCVVCRGIPQNNAAQLAERLRAVVSSQPFDFESKTIAVTLSLGVAAYPELKLNSATEITAAADAALLQAKRAGRNRVVVAWA